MTSDNRTVARRKVRLATVTLLAVVSLSGAAGSDDEWQRSTLKGLDAILVRVEQEGLPNEIHNWLKTELELRLREAGIRVPAEREISKVPGGPVLTLVVVGQKHEATGLYAFRVDLELGQAVALLRSSRTTVQATTWRSRMLVGTVGARNMPDYIRDTAQQVTGEFLNAYLSANPRTERPPGVW
jgi:hypothetical protein